MPYSGTEMQIDNAVITESIRQISEHFRTNIANRFTNRALSGFIPSDLSSHGLLALLTERVEDYNLHGLHIDDLYLSILAAARLVGELRSRVLPNIRALVYSDSTIGQSAPTDKVMRDMAISNFGGNLRLYSTKLAELYALVEAYDISNSGGKAPVKNRFPELNNLHDLLQ